LQDELKINDEISFNKFKEAQFTTKIYGSSSFVVGISGLEDSNIIMNPKTVIKK
jgi:hypothetical protein